MCGAAGVDASRSLVSSLLLFSGGLRPAGTPDTLARGAPYLPTPLAWLTRCARSLLLKWQTVHDLQNERREPVVAGRQPGRDLLDGSSIVTLQAPSQRI